jgi:RNA polymerase sigma-70 factor, ECF subfamily
MACPVGEPVESFETFYRREYPRVVALAYALSGGRAVAEDLAQDAFLATHQRWRRVGAYEHPGAYVRRVVANASVSAGRRRAAERRALGRLAGRARSPVDDLEPPDAEFWRAVRSLSPRQAQAIALYYLEDRTTEEIGAVLGCAPATVSVHLHRGRAALVQLLNLEANP